MLAYRTLPPHLLPQSEQAEAKRPAPPFSAPADLTPMQAEVLRMLHEAAAWGLPCPNNLEITAAVGAKSESYAGDMLRKLERAGHISVFRAGNRRQVTITATGAKTAPIKARRAA